MHFSALQASWLNLVQMTGKTTYIYYKSGQTQISHTDLTVSSIAEFCFTSTSSFSDGVHKRAATTIIRDSCWC